MTARLSHAAIGPGTRMSLVVEISPKKGMHVYAPGGQYRPVVVSVAPDRALTVHDVVYPTPTKFEFKPLNETWLVYGAPFRLVLDLTVGDTAEQRADLRTRSTLPIKGKLDYQACDDSVCYFPTSIPFEWIVKVMR